MSIDIDICSKNNVIDTCSVWNILSSMTLFEVSQEHKFDFCMTKFVEYECLHKPRTDATDHELELKKRLESQKKKGKFPSYGLTLEDLQHEDILKVKGRFGKGELSSIAFAKKIGIGFLTDDQGARKNGVAVLGKHKVETCPLILKWLILNNLLTDSDTEAIIADHLLLERPLEKHFRAAHEDALRIKYYKSIGNTK